MIPLYILAIKLNLVGSFRGLVIAYCVTAIPFSIWILKGYYDTIPIDLEEAARIDGCNQMEAFWQILLPLSTPSLAIVFLFNFTTAWNDYLLARVILGSQETLLNLAAWFTAHGRTVPDPMGTILRRIHFGSHSGHGVVPVLIQVVNFRFDPGQCERLVISNAQFEPRDSRGSFC